jgi:hypothetical protein
MVIGSNSFVVPLDFLDVSAKRKNNASVVEWKTANEVDVDRYEVQKGVTPTFFATVGTVRARNLQSDQAYSLADAGHTSGVAYYRIKSIDNNGAYKYSKVVSLTINEKWAQPVLLTNPAKTQLVLSVPENHTHYQYQLTTTGGQVMLQGEISKQANTITIPLTAMPVGVYHLSLRYANNTFYQKVLIQ